MHVKIVRTSRDVKNLNRLRVTAAEVVADDMVVTLFAYAKSEQEDQTTEQKRAAVALLKDFTHDES